jgi:hypothetical protein
MLFTNYFFMKAKQIVAILGLIGLLASVILPFLNFTEDGEKIQPTATNQAIDGSAQSTTK